MQSAIPNFPRTVEERKPWFINLEMWCYVTIMKANAFSYWQCITKQLLMSGHEINFPAIIKQKNKIVNMIPHLTCVLCCKRTKIFNSELKNVFLEKASLFQTVKIHWLICKRNTSYKILKNDILFTCVQYPLVQENMLTLIFDDFFTKTKYCWENNKAFLVLL